MTSSQPDARAAIRRLLDALAESTADLTEGELLAEAEDAGEDPASIAAEMRAIALDAVRNVRGRLQRPDGQARETTPLPQQSPPGTSSKTFGKDEVRRTLRLLLALPHQFKPLIAVQAFSTSVSFQGSTPDGRLRWRIVDEGPVVVANLETELEELVDMPGVRLHWGDSVENVVFAKCAGRVVGTAVFSKAQLGDRNQTEALHLEIDGLDGEFSR